MVANVARPRETTSVEQDRGALLSGPFFARSAVSLCAEASSPRTVPALAERRRGGTVFGDSPLVPAAASGAGVLRSSISFPDPDIARGPLLPQTDPEARALLSQAMQSVDAYDRERGIFQDRFGFGKRPAIVVVDFAYGWTDDALCRSRKPQPSRRLSQR